MIENKIPEINVEEIMERFREEVKLLKQQNYNLNELLKYHDTDFITNAYKAILGRTPDTNGLDYYLKQLRNGELCKAEILGHLRFSPEGRQKKISMKGLFIPFIFHRSLKTPVLGKVLRIFVGLVNLPAILRKIQLENYRK